jgi:hypothetical protein
VLNLVSGIKGGKQTGGFEKKVLRKILELKEG